MAEANKPPRKPPPKKDPYDAPVKARDVKPEKIEWLWERRIPKGQVVVVAGKPDQGKGLFVVFLSAYVSRKYGHVLHSAIEDSPEQMTRPRLEAVGADLTKIDLHNGFGLPKGLDHLTEIVRKKKTKLVVIDPLSGHLSGSTSRRNDSIRQVTTPLKRLAGETGCTFVIVEHTVKTLRRDAHPLDAIGGASSGLPAAARMAFVFGKDPKDEDRTLLCAVKHNLRDKPKAIEFESEIEELPLVGEIPYLIQQGEVEFDPMKILMRPNSGKKGRRADKRAEAAEWLVNHLATHGTLKGSRVYEDAKQMGLSQRTVRRAADELKIQRSGGGGKNVTWSLPAALLTLATKANKKGAGNGS